MLKQNLNDKCYSMANIFSFAEKVIPDFEKEFENKSEGEKFLFLYCITAKLLSNRLYDNESAEDKIKCLLRRIKKDKEKDAEQLKSALNAFVEQNKLLENNDYYSAKKVKSFFDDYKDLLKKIYGHEKPADLLLFFAQMQSKNIFEDNQHRGFFDKVNNAKIEEKTFKANEASYWINGQVVDKQQIKNSLGFNPDRNFNTFIDEIDKNCALNILQNDEYKTRGFKLEKRNYNEKWMVSDFKPDINKANENNYKSEDEYISQTLDIDEILKKKFGFKKINEISKDELKNLNLSYDKEFIYFLSGCDLGNEVYLQNRSRLEEFKAPDIPFKNIRPETILKIYNYFDKTQLNKKTIEEVIKQFDNPKNLFEAYDEMQKENEKSLGFKKHIVANLYFENPVKIDKVFKYIDQLDTENLTKIDDNTKKMIFDFLDKTLNNKQNFQAILNKFLQTENDGGNLLFRFIFENIDKQLDKFKNHLVEICTSYKSKEYDSAKKQKVGCLIFRTLNRLSRQIDNVRDPGEYIKMIIGLFSNGESKFEIIKPNSTEATDETQALTNILKQFIDQYLEAPFTDDHKHIEKKRNSTVTNRYSYNLEKVFGVFKKSYDPQQDQNGYDKNDIDVITNQLEFYKEILNSPVVEIETKKTILELAKFYLDALKKTYSDFSDSQLKLYSNKYATNYKVSISQKYPSKDQLTYRKTSLSQSIVNLESRIRTLDMKSNVTSYFMFNFKTWLSFLLIVPIFLYNFKWKPQYISEKTNLQNEYNEQKSELDELKKVEEFNYVNTDSGKSHEELIDKVQKFINNGNGILRQQNQQQNKIILNNKEEMDEEIFEDDEEEYREL